MCQDQGWPKSTGESLHVSTFVPYQTCHFWPVNLPFSDIASPSWQWHLHPRGSHPGAEPSHRNNKDSARRWMNILGELSQAEHGWTWSPKKPSGRKSTGPSWNQVAPPCWNAPGWAKEDLLARMLAYLGMACNGPTTSYNHLKNWNDQRVWPHVHKTTNGASRGNPLAKLHHLHPSPEHGTWPAGSSPFSNCFENEQLYFKGWMMMDESDQKWPKSWEIPSLLHSSWRSYMSSTEGKFRLADHVRTTSQMLNHARLRKDRGFVIPSPQNWTCPPYF